MKTTYVNDLYNILIEQLKYAIEHTFIFNSNKTVFKIVCICSVLFVQTFIMN